MLKRVAITLALAALLARVAVAAPSVQLTIRDGRVWLTAQRATASDILAEWSRLGATRIVNAERLAGPPLTLDLRGVTELEALDVIMRTAGGFVAVSRIGTADARSSQFSQIVIVPSKAGGAPAAPEPMVAVPVPPAPAQAPILTESGAQRVIGPDGQVVPDDQEDAPPSPPAGVTPTPAGMKSGGSMPPGFSEPPSATPPPGAARPGLIAPAIPPRRPGGVISD